MMLEMIMNINPYLSITLVITGQKRNPTTVKESTTETTTTTMKESTKETTTPTTKRQKVNTTMAIKRTMNLPSTTPTTSVPTTFTTDSEMPDMDARGR